jgi:hypothetical protein
VKAAIGDNYGGARRRPGWRCGAVLVEEAMGGPALVRRGEARGGASIEEAVACVVLVEGRPWTGAEPEAMAEGGQGRGQSLRRGQGQGRWRSASRGRPGAVAGGS